MAERKSSVDGLRIVIAGGATGVGAAVAKRLARHGARIVIGDINIQQAAETAASITSSGGMAIAVAFDLSQEDTIRNLIESGAKAFDGIDGLINMGADYRLEILGNDGNVLDMDAAVWRRTLDVNLVGYALTTKYVLPYLFKQGGGSIVNISSVIAWMCEPSYPAYAAAKAGVHVLTRHTASSAGHKNVRANCVSIGIVETERVKEALNYPVYQKKFIDPCPLKRAGELEEAASLIEYLISREATFITGQVWGVNGGVMMRE
ncbi:short-chain dehydrogenase reductase sdr [Trichoderma arundinaceum]|uniref:Short-chain dehydrogenase reductase sdr n=1 Tax=Trichoderma arundinaceum TaxID=490622 RepID=A0A395NQ98_TRIAR|nr:short-chain dehydrogenase reductase sdr [Trichoderma arundinaceum]